MSALVHGDRQSVQLISDATIGRVLDATCRRHGLREALVFYGGSEKAPPLQLTFTELRANTDQLGAGLMRFFGASLQPGDVVAFWGANHANHLIGAYACFKAGLIVSGIGHGVSQEALVSHLNAVDAKAIVCFPTVKPGHCYDILTRIEPGLVSCPKNLLDSKILPTLKHVIIDEDEKYKGTTSLSDIMITGSKDKSGNEKLLNDVDMKLTPDSIAAIQATGSMDSPKYVTLSHFQLINSCLVACNRLGLSSKTSEILCCPMPIFRGPVLGFAGLAACVVGAKVVFPSPLSTAPAILTAIQEQKCTCLLTNPIAFHLMLRMPATKNFSLDSITSLCLVVDHTTSEHAAVFNEKLPNLENIISGVFLTEAGCFAFMYPRNTKPDDIGKFDGKIMDFYSAKILNFDGHEAKFDEPGRLYMKLVGDSPFLGYHKQPALKKEYFSTDGWLKTGDVAKINQDGFATLLGSEKDLIHRNQKSIVPYFLEKLLMSHNAVLACQVVGVEDKKLGEKVCACIAKQEKSSLSESQLEEELLKMCTVEKIDRPDAFIFLQDLPRTLGKKIDKPKLKIVAAAKLL